MEMRQITESYEAEAALYRVIDQTARNHIALKTVFYPIFLIGGTKVSEILWEISKFWAAADVGRFKAYGKRYRLKSSERGFRIVAV